MRNMRKLCQKGVSMIEYAILLGLLVGFAVVFFKGDGMIGSVNTIVRNVQMIFDEELKASEARKNFVVDTLPEIIGYFDGMLITSEDYTFMQSTYDDGNAIKNKFLEFLTGLEPPVNLADDYNIQYYGYSQKWGVFRWSTVDINNMNVGEKMPVIQYSNQTKAFEFYEIKVQQDANGNKYTNISFDAADQHQGLTYEQAEKLYNDAVAKLPDNAKPK